jgi:hypothetical protein
MKKKELPSDFRCVLRHKPSDVDKNGVKKNIFFFFGAVVPLFRLWKRGVYVTTGSERSSIAGGFSSSRQQVGDRGRLSYSGCDRVYLEARLLSFGDLDLYVLYAERE